MKHRPTALWMNNTGTDVSFADAEISAACLRGDGVLPEEIADLFTLERTPAGSAAAWRLAFKADDVAEGGS